MHNSRTKSRIGLAEVMYVLGGFGNLQSPVDVVEKYDPATNQWCIVQVSIGRRTYNSLSVIENECRVMSKPGHSVDLRSLHAFGVRTFFATLRYDNGDDYENIT